MHTHSHSSQNARTLVQTAKARVGRQKL